MTNKLKITKIKNSGRKITKLLILLGIKEGYLLVRNVYGMVEHPTMTFNRIYRKKDYSQTILIFGIPIGLWLAWVFVLLISRIFIFGRLHFGFWAKVSFLGSTLITLIVFLLLTYCFYLVWKKGRRGSESS